MKNKKLFLFFLLIAVVFLLTLYGDPSWFTLLVPAVFAHCDTMDGPVVKAAMKALDTGNADHVLIWVKEKDEGKLKKAFNEALKARKESPKGKKRSDMRFFEALVRIHREGEGAPYEGIKPAGSEIEPGIEAADKAVESGSSVKLQAEMSRKIAAEINKKFRHLKEKKKTKDRSVEAGREYVEAYVEFIHFIEKLHLDLSGKSEHHD